MASRTISVGIGDDVESALDFLSKQKEQDISSFFMDKVKKVMDEALVEADNKRFELARQLLNQSDKGKAISDLKKLLG